MSKLKSLEQEHQRLLSSNNQTEVSFYVPWFDMSITWHDTIQIFQNIHMVHGRVEFGKL